MAAHPRSRDEIFKSFVENLQLVVDKLTEDVPSRDAAEFNFPEYWIKMEIVFKAMSFEATKLAMCFSKPPVPSLDECQSLLSSVEMKTIALVSLYYGLPKEQGVTLRKCTRNMVAGVVESIKELAEGIKMSGYKSSDEQLQSTGAVWESCDIIHSSAKNNKEAVLKELKATSGLVKDAVEELNEAKDTNGSSGGFDFLLTDEEPGMDEEDEAVWSDQDKAVIHPALGLASACKACVKKVTDAINRNAKYVEMVHINELDEVAEIADEISPNLDELVSCLYAPMTYTVVRANATLMAEVLHKLLNTFRTSHMVTTDDPKIDDRKWMDFLTKAIDHNVDQIKNITKEEIPR
nr:cyclin-D1-binding protein 1 homolog isoform X2 [Lytechinus pictus]